RQNRAVLLPLSDQLRAVRGERSVKRASNGLELELNRPAALADHRDRQILRALVETVERGGERPVRLGNLERQAQPAWLGTQAPQPVALHAWPALGERRRLQC